MLPLLLNFTYWYLGPTIIFRWKILQNSSGQFGKLRGWNREIPRLTAASCLWVNWADSFSVIEGLRCASVKPWLQLQFHYDPTTKNRSRVPASSDIQSDLDFTSWLSLGAGMDGDSDGSGKTTAHGKRLLLIPTALEVLTVCRQRNHTGVVNRKTDWRCGD